MSGITLLLLDQTISFSIIAPLTVFYWRGTWSLIDFAFNDYPDAGIYFSLAVGNVGMCIACLLQGILSERLNKKNLVVWFFLFHLYTYIVGFFCVNAWRGIWALTDDLTEKGPVSHAVSLGMGSGLLMMLRSTSTCQAPPLIVAIDVDQSCFFSCSTRFQTDVKKDMESFVLDSLFSCIVIQNAAVLYWRGLWGLLDNFTFPDDPQLSGWFCLAVSLLLMVILVPSQLTCDILFRRCREINSRTSRVIQVLLQTLLYAVGNACAVFLWRGMWTQCAFSCLLDNEVSRAWLDHGLGIGLLMLLGCGNSVVAKGCCVDGDGDAEGGCLLGNRYLRYWFKARTQVSRPDKVRSMISIEDEQ